MSCRTQANYPSDGVEAPSTQQAYIFWELKTAQKCLVFVVSSSPELWSYFLTILSYNAGVLMAQKKRKYTRLYCLIFSPYLPIRHSEWYEKLQIIVHIWQLDTCSTWRNDLRPKELYASGKPYLYRQLQFLQSVWKQSQYFFLVLLSVLWFSILFLHLFTQCGGGES